MTKDEFWVWFNNHKILLEDFISGKIEDNDIYNSLSDVLRQYNEYLVPELTMTKDNKFVLVISCDGMKEGIIFAEALTANLGHFENWEIKTFRQPEPMETIPLDGLNLKRNNIFVIWQKNSMKKYHLTFFIKGYSTKVANFEIGALLHLDHTIGEYAAMTRIEGIELRRLGFLQSKKDLKTLDDLKVELDQNFA